MTSAIISAELALPLYDDLAKQNTIHAAGLSRIAQELGFMLRVPSPDIPGDVWAELQRIHKDACDALDAGRATSFGP